MRGINPPRKGHVLHSDSNSHRKTQQTVCLWTLKALRTEFAPFMRLIPASSKGTIKAVKAHGSYATAVGPQYDPHVLHHVHHQCGSLSGITTRTDRADTGSPACRRRPGTPWPIQEHGRKIRFLQGTCEYTSAVTQAESGQ